MNEQKLDAILEATPWRCFHCDFITNNHEEAAAHFGDRDDPEEFKPLCRWWARMEAGERIQEFQTLIKEAHQREDEIGRQRVAIEGLEYQVGTNEPSIRGYKPFRGCSSIYDVFCLYDSMEGRALAAEQKVKEQEGCGSVSGSGAVAGSKEQNASVVQPAPAPTTTNDAELNAKPSPLPSSRQPSADSNVSAAPAAERRVVLDAEGHASQKGLILAADLVCAAIDYNSLGRCANANAFGQTHELIDGHIVPPGTEWGLMFCDDTCREKFYAAIRRRRAL